MLGLGFCYQVEEDEQMVGRVASMHECCWVGKGVQVAEEVWHEHEARGRCASSGRHANIEGLGRIHR